MPDQQALQNVMPSIYVIFISLVARRKLDLLSCANTESFKKPYYTLHGLQNRPYTSGTFSSSKKKTTNKQQVHSHSRHSLNLSSFRIFTVHYSKKNKKHTHKQIKLELPSENSAFSLASDSSNFIDLANFQLWKQEAKPLSKTILKLLLESYF